jgi:hypothetical protein
LGFDSRRNAQRAAFETSMVARREVRRRDDQVAFELACKASCARRLGGHGLVSFIEAGSVITGRRVRRRVAKVIWNNTTILDATDASECFVRLEKFSFAVVILPRVDILYEQQSTDWFGAIFQFLATHGLVSSGSTQTLRLFSRHPDFSNLQATQMETNCLVSKFIIFCELCDLELTTLPFQDCTSTQQRASLCTCQSRTCLSIPTELPPSPSPPPSSSTMQLTLTPTISQTESPSGPPSDPPSEVSTLMMSSSQPSFQSSATVTPITQAPNGNTALIGGIVGGILALLVIAAVIAVVVVRSRRRRRRRRHDDNQSAVDHTYSRPPAEVIVYDDVHDVRAPTH